MWCVHTVRCEIVRAHLTSTQIYELSYKQQHPTSLCWEITCADSPVWASLLPLFWFLKFEQCVFFCCSSLSRSKIKLAQKYIFINFAVIFKLSSIQFLNSAKSSEAVLVFCMNLMWALNRIGQMLSNLRWSIVTNRIQSKLNCWIQIDVALGDTNSCSHCAHLKNNPNRAVCSSFDTVEQERCRYSTAKFLGR